MSGYQSSQCAAVSCHSFVDGSRQSTPAFMRVAGRGRWPDGPNSPSHETLNSASPGTSNSPACASSDSPTHVPSDIARDPAAAATSVTSEGESCASTQQPNLFEFAQNPSCKLSVHCLCGQHVSQSALRMPKRQAVRQAIYALSVYSCNA